MVRFANGGDGVEEDDILLVHDFIQALESSKGEMLCYSVRKMKKAKA